MSYQQEIVEDTFYWRSLFIYIYVYLQSDYRIFFHDVPLAYGTRMKWCKFEHTIYIWGIWNSLSLYEDFKWY